LERQSPTIGLEMGHPEILDAFDREPNTLGRCRINPAHASPTRRYRLPSAWHHFTIVGDASGAGILQTF
jgi:hypothetical protein